jgi:Tfp pilus assembly protein PilO
MATVKNTLNSGENFVSRMVNSLRADNILTHEKAIEFLPYIFLLAFLAMLFIANSYYAEKTIREIDHVSNELKELRSEYITTKSDLMVISKQSQVAKMAASLGIRESVVPPKKLIIRKANSK